MISTEKFMQGFILGLLQQNFFSDSSGMDTSMDSLEIPPEMPPESLSVINSDKPSEIPSAFFQVIIQCAARDFSMKILYGSSKDCSRNPTSNS